MDDLLAELRAENAALRASLTDLARAEERFRVLFEHSSDAHLIFDAGGILDCNNAAISMLRGSSKAEVLGLHPAVLSPEHQPDGQRSLDKSVEMDRIARERGLHRFEWIHRRMTGEDFPVQVTLTPVTLSSGPAYIVVWHELTEQRRREQALREQAVVVARQAQVIRRLSTPVIAVAEGVLLVPIVGALDGARAAEMNEAVLHAIALRRARAVIVDLTGVEEFDASTAGHIVELGSAAALLGAEAILAGIGPSVARTLVDLGTDLRRLRTAADAGEALRRALRR